jgi:putative DNA primase/helicase
VSWANYDDVVDQLRAGGLMLDGGIEVDSAKPMRVRVDGEDREKRGWYWLASKEINGGRYITGAWGVYHGADSGKQAIILRRDGQALELSAEERAAIRTRHEANVKRARALRQAEADRAAIEAERVWRAYLPTGRSDYLERKGVQAYGLRFSPSGNGTVAVPMLRGGRVVGLQIIRGRERGRKLEKQYWPAGMDKSGAYHLIGAARSGGVLLVAEGYATAATLHEASGLPVAVAFDAGSLRPVAEALAKAYRSSRLLLCADDDYRTPGNPGVTAAQNAAFAVGGAHLVPAFSVERPPEGPRKPTDFNDLAALEGLHVVREQVERALSGLGWSASATPARGSAPKGSGERAEIPSVLQIGEAAERYAFVYGGKGTMFDVVEHMLVPKADVLDILPEHGWRDLRAIKRVVRMEEVGFDPAGSDPAITCNLWGGWPTVPRAGCCDRLLELLEYLCSGEHNTREIYQWVLRWIAYPIQHPGAKMKTALIFHGRQGTGKNLFFEALMGIYGEYGRIVDQAAVEDKFNDWASRKLFLIADEVVARAELYHVKNKLKGIVTGEWIRINPKNVAAHDERNHCNLVFLSNETQPLILEKDDRRYTVIWTPDKLSEAFYREVRAEIDAGGQAALHQHLLDLDLGDFDEHTKPPMTRAKMELIDRSLDSVERFLLEWQAGDVIADPRQGPVPFCPCASSQLYRVYLDWCRRMGEPRPRPENQFGGDLLKRPGWVKGHRDRRESHNTARVVRQRFVIPSEEALSDAVKAGRDDYRLRPDENKTEWLTRCFFEFGNAMGESS